MVLASRYNLVIRHEVLKPALLQCDNMRMYLRGADKGRKLSTHSVAEGDGGRVKLEFLQCMQSREVLGSLPGAGSF